MSWVTKVNFVASFCNTQYLDCLLVNWKELCYNLKKSMKKTQDRSFLINKIFENCKCKLDTCTVEIS